jgi:hypothetical protein
MAVRVEDLQDLLKMLTQTTERSVPDNPAEVLALYDYGTDDVATADAVSFPDFGHSPAYVYNDATSMWNRAQWS